MSLEVDSGGRELRWLYDGDGAHYARVDRELPADGLPEHSLGWAKEQYACGERAPRP
jgi:hypothetical protein